MITCTRQLARQAHDIIRRALGKQNASLAAVVVQAGPEGLRIRSWNLQTAVQYQQSSQSNQNGSCDVEQIVLPLEALKVCAGSRPEPVTIETGPDQNTVLRWNDEGIPQVAHFAIPELLGEFPPQPERLQKTGDDFLRALCDASDTTESEPGRFASNCLRFCGSNGSIEATDTRQALIQSGFRFGWGKSGVLVPANPVFKSPCLSRDCQVRIGKTDQWITLALGAWSISLFIEQERRFPDIAGCIPASPAVVTQLRISESDSQFLKKSLSRLPGDEGLRGLVTLDLNGAVALRARSRESSIPTELVLTGSSRTGQEICLCTDRRFLERALRLGFREIGFVSPEAPAVCRDERRTYIWALLPNDSIVKPSETAVRIESSFPPEQPTEGAPLPNPPEDADEHRPSKSTDRAMKGADIELPQFNHPDNVSSIRQVRQLQTNLRATLRQTRDVLAALRQNPKRSRSVVR